MLTKSIVFTVSFVFFISMFGGSMLRTMENNGLEFIESSHFLDVTVTDVFGLDSTLGYEFIEQLNEIEGTDNTVFVSFWKNFLLANNIEAPHCDVILVSLESLILQYEMNVNISDAENEVLVTKDFASRKNISVGDSLTIWVDPYPPGDLREIELPITASYSFIVGGIIDTPYFVHSTVDIYIDWNNSVIDSDYFIFEKAFIQTTDTSRTIDNLEKLSEFYPSIRWSTLQEAIEQNEIMFRERYGMFILIVAAITLIICLGVINTVLSGIYSRKREYSVLRVIGAKKSEIKATIYAQVSVYILYALILGVLSGLLLSFVIAILLGRSFLVYDYSLIPVVLGGFTLLLMLIIRPRIDKFLKDGVLVHMN